MSGRLPTTIYKNLFLTLLFAFYICSVYSQGKEELQIVSAAADTLIPHKVMLIPFDPLYYLSDAEQDIIEQTKKDPEKIRDSFRRTIDYNIKQAILKHYPCISLLNDVDSMPSLKEVLILVYSKTGYRYDKVMPTLISQGATDTLKKKKNNSSEIKDSKIAAEYVTVKGDAQYMNAVIKKPTVLNELYNQYGTDVFVFVNQFEIKTNYNSCLDIANKIYKRELMLHFSIFNKEGKQLAGSYAMSFFPSDTNAASDIMKNCFPDIARFVAACIP
jgi:hypothetical protein